MAKKQSSYWVKRFETVENASNTYGQSVYRRIEPVFNQAQREIQSEIERWYSRLAVNNQISLTEARRLLTAKELAEFKWDVGQFIAYGEQNALDGAWMTQLENASARYHISRLEAMKIRTQQEFEKAFGNQLDSVDSMARHVYAETYYHSAYEIQRGLNVGWDIARVDSRRLETLIAKPWAADGKNFSDRIWQAKTSMVNDLHNELVRTCILGKSPDDAIKRMTQYVNGKVKNAKSAAGNLVMTEQAFFSSAAQQDCFNELDVEEYEIVATLDSLTSERCRELDGKHFPMKDFRPGVTAPPFHPRCRSTTVPWFEDNYGGKRAARDKDGNTYYVPDTMSYSDWEKSFAAGGSKEGLSEKLTVGRSSGKVGDTEGYTTIDAIREIDFTDKTAIEREIEAFRSKHSFSDIEHGIVITPSGKVYELTGTEGAVNPEIIGVGELKGSIGAHNHPVWSGHDRGDSFSREDLLFSARHMTGAEHLVSGNRRDNFLYTGILSEDDLYKAYDDAKNKVLNRAWESDIEIEWRQADIMRELATTLEGLMFDENV